MTQDDIELATTSSDQEELSRLLHTHDKQVWVALLENPSLSCEALDKISESAAPDILAQVARHPKVKPEMLVMLSRSHYLDVRVAVAEQVHNTFKTLVFFSNTEAPGSPAHVAVSSALARRARVEEKGSSVFRSGDEIRDYLQVFPQTAGRHRLLRLPGCPSDLVRKHFDSASGLEYHPNCPADLQKPLDPFPENLESTTVDQRWGWAMSPYTTEPQFHRLYAHSRLHDDWSAIRALLCNPNFPESLRELCQSIRVSEILELLDPSAALPAYAKASPAYRDVMTWHPDPNVVVAALQKGKQTPERLQALLHSKHVEVRRAASLNLKGELNPDALREVLEAETAPDIVEDLVCYAASGVPWDRLSPEALQKVARLPELDAVTYEKLGHSPHVTALMLIRWSEEDPTAGKHFAAQSRYPEVVRYLATQTSNGSARQAALANPALQGLRDLEPTLSPGDLDGLLANPRCPQDILRKYAQQSLYVRSLSKNPNTPPEYLGRWLQQGVWVEHLLANPSTPLAAISSVLPTLSFEDSRTVISNPNLTTPLVQQVRERFSNLDTPGTLLPDRDKRRLGLPMLTPSTPSRIFEYSRCPQEIEKAASNATLGDIPALATNPHTPSSVLDHIIDDGSEGQRAVLAKCLPKGPALDLLRELHPSLPPRDENSSYLKAGLQDVKSLQPLYQSEARMLYLKDPSRTIEVAGKCRDGLFLEVLHLHADPEVRRTVAANPSTDLRTLYNLTQDYAPSVAEAALYRLSPEQRRSILETASAHSDFWQVRARHAADHSVPPEDLAKLSFDNDYRVRAQVKASPNLTPELLKLLNEDPETHVRLQKPYQSPIDPAPVGYRKHNNGGGLVALTASVDAATRVEKGCWVHGAAQVRHSTLEGHSIVEGDATVQGSCLSGHVRVGGQAKVCGSTLRDLCLVKGRAQLAEVVAADFAVVDGDSHVEDSYLYDQSFVAHSTIRDCTLRMMATVVNSHAKDEILTHSEDRERLLRDSGMLSATFFLKEEAEVSGAATEDAVVEARIDGEAEALANRDTSAETVQSALVGSILDRAGEALGARLGLLTPEGQNVALAEAVTNAMGG